MSRWQYHVVNIGTFNAAERMAAAFGHLGSEGWELVAINDKASNWLGGFEKGFAVFKREVSDGAEPTEPWGQWQYATDVGRDESLGNNPTKPCRAGNHGECARRWCTCACHAEAPSA